VGAERRPLHVVAAPGGAEPVESRLPDRDDDVPVGGGEVANVGDGVVEGHLVVRGEGGLPAVGADVRDVGMAGGLVGVDRDGRADGGMGAGEVDAGLEVRQLARGVDQADDVRAGRPGELDVDGQGGDALGEVLDLPEREVGVVVDDGAGQFLTLGREPGGLRLSHGRPSARSPPPRSPRPAW